MSDEGFFVSPAGEVLAVPTSHIAMVVADPGRFGLTRTEVDQAFSRYDEPIGSEGRAREALLRQVLDAGWIRARRHANRGWSIEVSEWGPEVQARIIGWAARLRRGHDGLWEPDQHVEVRIRGLVDGTLRTSTFGEVR